MSDRGSSRTRRRAARREPGLDLLDDRAQLLDPQRGAQEVEVLDEIELCGVAPQSRERNVRLAHERRLWIVRGRDLLPACIDVEHLRAIAHVRHSVAKLTVLDERVRDIDSEAADAAVEPEAKDLFELTSDVGVPPVEVGLRGRELVQVVAAPDLVVRPGRPAREDRRPVVRNALGPHVVLRVLAKPRMADRRVVRDEVEPELDPAPARIGDQRVEVVERAVLGVDAEVVGHVVAPVDVGGRKGRAQPDRVDAEPLQVVELRAHSAEVADPVAVRVAERADVHVVENAQPIDQVSPEATSDCRSPAPASVARSSWLCTSSS